MSTKLWRIQCMKEKVCTPLLKMQNRVRIKETASLCITFVFNIGHIIIKEFLYLSATSFCYYFNAIRGFFKLILCLLHLLQSQQNIIFSQDGTGKSLWETYQ